MHRERWKPLDTLLILLLPSFDKRMPPQRPDLAWRAVYQSVGAQVDVLCDVLANPRRATLKYFAASYLTRTRPLLYCFYFPAALAAPTLRPVRALC
jgi:hypothetical protein